MMTRHLALLVLFGLSLPGAAAELVKVGGRDLQVPAPEGFVRIDGVNKGFDEMQRGFVAQQNRLLIYLGREDDRNSLKAGDTPTLERSMNLQVMKELEPLNVSTQDFQNLKSSVRQEITGLDASEEFESYSKDVERKLEDGTGDDATVEVTQPGEIKLVDESPDQITFGMNLNLKVATETEGVTQDVQGYVAWSMVRVHGMVINLYCNANTEGPVERKWARDTVAAWGKTILATNDELAAVMADVPETTDGDGGGGMSGIFRGALIGAVIGGIFGIVQAIRKKKR